MTPERWQHVRQVYERVAALDAGGRAATLEEACEGDADLRATVLAMLAAEASGAALGSVVDRAAAAWFDESPASVEVLPDTPPGIARYRIEERLGEGGMGVVHAAIRSDGLLRRRFAVKVLRRGMDTETFVRRFAAERAALERLDHPSIARLFDAGACEDGRPYLVMELVEGMPIDAWCRGRNPGLRTRVALMAQLCDAVAYAHGRLVIHRDIKPSNILVDRSDRPKLMDFGIARILDDEAGATVTRTTDRILTPRYASPELLLGEPVSAASDVYSLGVVLYELLTGASPYATGGGTRSEIERAVREQTPRRPSAMADAAIAAGNAVAIPGRLLRGDLDTIVAQAMRPDPERRYQSAAALAADLRAYLESRPIAARPESLLYELRKLVHRHPWQAGTAGVAVAGLLALTVVALSMARRATSAEVDAERALGEAQAQAAISRNFGAFLTDEFLLLLDPARSMDGAITLEEAVLRAADRVRGRFPDEPLAEALIEHTFGDAFIQRTLHAEAEPHLRRAWTLREMELGPEHGDTLIAKRDLASALMFLGRQAEAKTLLEEVLAVQQRTIGADHGLTLLTMSVLARALSELGEDGEAERLYLVAYQERRRVLGPRNGNTMSSMNQLGTFYTQRKRYEEALPYLEDAARLRREEYGDDHPRTLIARANLATVEARMGETDRAVAELRAVREVQLRVLGAGHAHTLHVLAQIAELERRRGDFAAAILAQQTHADATAEARGGRSVPAIESRLALVELLLDAGRRNEAIEQIEAVRSAASIASAAGDLPESVTARLAALAMRLE
ncbi:MAG: serine/threonine protein kinase [Phycisphaerales bacterium]|nr:serine/threonine protein kinase [Phycisphaerales bacterium]